MGVTGAVLVGQCYVSLSLFVPVIQPERTHEASGNGSSSSGLVGHILLALFQVFKLST